MATVMITVSYLAEIPEEIAGDEEALNTLLDGFSDALSGDRSAEVAGTEYPLDWVSADTKLLDPETENCGRCAKCGILVTDMEEENPIEGLVAGATVNGQLLCDECLPLGHPWAL